MPKEPKSSTIADLYPEIVVSLRFFSLQNDEIKNLPLRKETAVGNPADFLWSWIQKWTSLIRRFFLMKASEVPLFFLNLTKNY